LENAISKVSVTEIKLGILLYFIAQFQTCIFIREMINIRKFSNQRQICLIGAFVLFWGFFEGIVALDFVLVGIFHYLRQSLRLALNSRASLKLSILLP
jgi:hypothetical protein